MENGNKECVKETTTQSKITKQMQVTNESSTQQKNPKWRVGTACPLKKCILDQQKWMSH